MNVPANTRSALMTDRRTDAGLSTVTLPVLYVVPAANIALDRAGSSCTGDRLAP